MATKPVSPTWQKSRKINEELNQELAKTALAVCKWPLLLRGPMIVSGSKPEACAYAHHPTMTFAASMLSATIVLSLRGEYIRKAPGAEFEPHSGLSARLINSLTASFGATPS